MYGDEESLRMFGKEHTIFIMNHTYDIDWIVCWYVANNFNMLANSKSCAKKALRNIPVIGWGWIFGELIFLERSWEKDKLTLGDKLDKLASYEDPITLLYFCEGTRFTNEKHKASIEFAKARNLPQLQHHLCPRTSGFNFTAKHLKGKVPAVYNVQLGFADTDKKPTLTNLLRGYSFTAYMHVERIPLDDVPTDSDEATSKWLHQLYQKKDKLMDDYFKTETFPGRCKKLSRSYGSLSNSIFWAVIVGVLWAYLIFKMITTCNAILISIVSTVFVILFSVIYYMVRATETNKGSSYGTDKNSPPEAKNGIFKHEIKSEVEDHDLHPAEEIGVKSSIKDTLTQTNNNL